MKAHRISELFYWYKTELGQRVMHAELAGIADVGNELFGCNAIQLGMHPEQRIDMPNILRHSAIMPDVIEDTEYIHAEFINLPIQTGCVDVVIALHALEFSTNPYQLLREIDRALDDDGQLVIVGFSPWSLAGLMRIAWPFKKRAVPWSGHYFSRHRVTEWLNLLNYDLVAAQSVFYNLPTQNAGLLNRCGWLERFLQRWFPAGGASYILHAQKRTTPLMPIRPRWRPSRSVVRPAASVKVNTGDYAKR